MWFLTLLLSIPLTLFTPGYKDNTGVRTFDFTQLEPYLHKQNDTVYLVNFWATWCGPCVKEIPAIEEVGEKYHNKKFKILLVSLDFPSQIDTSLLPFIRKNKITSEVVLLNDAHQNQWIDKVDPAWSGELPFTIIYSRNFREYYSRSFEFNQLDSIIHLKLSSI